MMQEALTDRFPLRMGLEAILTPKWRKEKHGKVKNNNLFAYQRGVCIMYLPKPSNNVSLLTEL